MYILYHTNLNCTGTVARVLYRKVLTIEWDNTKYAPLSVLSTVSPVLQIGVICTLYFMVCIMLIRVH